MDSSQLALQSNEFFFQISILFLKFWLKSKKYSNKEVWILIKLQCVILLYQWIRLDKLYKLMETFFFFNFGIIFQISYNFLNNGGVGLMHAMRGAAFVLDSTRNLEL